jgi:hypothetical protein
MASAARTAAADHAIRSRVRFRTLRSRLGDPSQLFRDVVRALPPIVRILRETFRDHVLERGRRERLQLSERLRILRHDRRDERSPGAAVERAFAGRHLIEQRAECEKVAAGVGLDPFELLRRHVLERAENRAFLGERPGNRRLERSAGLHTAEATR